MPDLRRGRTMLPFLYDIACITRTGTAVTAHREVLVQMAAVLRAPQLALCVVSRTDRVVVSIASFPVDSKVIRAPLGDGQIGLAAAGEGLTVGDQDELIVSILFEGVTVGLLVMKIDETTVDRQHAEQVLTIAAALYGSVIRVEQAALESREEPGDDNVALHDELSGRFHPPNMVGKSRKIQAIYNLVGQVAAAPTSVLIRGESGTGKELVAEAIHQRSQRAGRAFIRVNCAALPESVIESELFGHERGAFTGAHALRKGRFELADRGTLFLDEIGDLSPATQAKLLRVLQSQVFERVGGTRTLQTDVRVIAATNRDLEAMVEQGTYRQDLYYRLNVFPLHLPPLRERRTDVILLADTFVEAFNKANKKCIERISTPAIDLLMLYHWPGNVRELQNCIERACLLSQDGVIHSHHLPPSLQMAPVTQADAAHSLPYALNIVENEMIVEALKVTRGNMSKAALRLGISERVLGLRMRKHGVGYKKYRQR